MKGISNRQKTVVKPRESFQKFVLAADRLKKGTDRKPGQELIRKPSLRKKRYS